MKGYTHDEQDTDIGAALIEILGLIVKDNGRVDTLWGDKTAMGLTRTIRRIIEVEGVKS